MCSNFDLASGRASEVVSYFEVDRPLFTQWQDEKSFFPGYQIPVVGLAAGSGRRLMIPAKWGLVPGHYSDPAQQPQPFNARSDTVARFDTFRESFERRRCLIPLAGFYEWTRAAPKVRYRLAPAGGGLFGVAGVYDVWAGEGRPRVVSAAMVTTGANALIGAFHDRCPAILPREQFAAWLDPAADPRELLALLVPWPSELMVKAEAPRPVRSKPVPRVQRSAARRSRPKPGATPGLFDTDQC